MRKIAIVLAAVAMIAGFAPPTTAHEVVSAANMETVADFHIPNPVHMEFLVRDGRTYALVGSRAPTASGGGLYIVDVTDPANPVRTGYVPCGQENNDPAVSADGTVVVITSNSGGCPVPPPRLPAYHASNRGYGIVDITDLGAPVLLGTPVGLGVPAGVHTAQFHPVEKVAYLSTQELATRAPTIEILDLRGATPQLVHWPALPVGSAPHDITFNPSGTRAYVSAVTTTYILDTTNPINPTLVSLVHSPLINIHHEALLTPNGRYLAVVDEQAGAIANPQCPGGGVHVFDLYDERLPVPVGAFFAQDFRTMPESDGHLEPIDIPECTAHEGNFTPDGKTLTVGWYNAGGRVFDTTALTALDTPPFAPVGFLVTEVAHYQTRGPYAWAAKTHPNVPGHVFISNSSGALEVARLTL